MNKSSQVNSFIMEAGTMMQTLARDNTRLTNDVVKLSTGLGLAQEEAAMFKVAHKMAAQGHFNYDRIPAWVRSKVSTLLEGGTQTAAYFENTLRENMDLSPADLSGAGRVSPAPFNKTSARRNTAPEPRGPSPISATALATMRKLAQIEL
jgi:hypothetical protein